ncbi:hypothetical protein OPIT5_20790 [Opitutaceae bacterium TAV5]|nr:hypothetical protein OPIT5_20790 [Opitutaceae bacterium TAV5]
MTTRLARLPALPARLFAPLACAFACLLACVCALAPARVDAAPPAPGTLIRAQAYLNYIDPVLFIGRETPSNIVRVLVGGAPGLDLQQDNAGTFAPGTYFAFVHTLTNTGNTGGAYTLTPALVAGGGFTPQNLALVIDANANSVVDPGETSLPFAPHAVTLAPGQTLQFIVTGLVPPSAPAAASLQLRIEASLAETGATAINTDTVATGGGELQFFKSVSPSTAACGEEITYTLSGTHNFPAALEPTVIAIDGATVSRVVVRDPLPGNIGLVSILAANGATPLYHFAGTAFHAYVTTAPADLSGVDAVAFAFDTIAPGVSFSVSFRARIGGQATGSIVNLASVYSTRPGGTPLVTVSNPATVSVPSVAPTIRYYDPPFARTVPASRLGNPLYVQVEAGACNERSDTVETVTVVITSSLTGDRETFTATETGPNTGIFRILPSVPSQDAAANPVVAGDGILQTLQRDELTAELTDCGGVTVRATILIDPTGIVYDSRTNRPVAGATVTLIDVTGAGLGSGGSAGGLARVYDEDGVTSVSATQVTGADGLFRYPIVAASTYRLEITPPENYSFPSVIPPGSQPAGRRIHASGSYGGSFPVDLSTGAVFLDVPVDTTVADGFVLEKTASRDTASIGDSVIYTLKLSNSSGAPFRGAYIDDRLPAGFRYERGTTRRDGAPVADPEGGVGPQLRFPVGTLADGDSATFTYRVRLTPGAEKGNGINIAQATSLGPPVLVSNQAQARVRPEAGIFDPSAVIIGTVFVDANGNDIQDPGEPGVPGVRLILEDGTYAITDGEGQYSIYGQRPVAHVLKLDPHTLPPGAKLGGKSPRFAGDPGSRFVDLKNHELHKANFMLVEPTESLYAAIEARRKQIDAWQPEIATALATTFNADGTPTLVSDPQGREAAGVIGSGRALPGPFENVLPAGTLTPANSSLPPSPVAAVPLVDLETVVAGLADAGPGFVDLRHGDTLPYDRVTLRVKGATGAKLELLLNGEPVPESRIGKIVHRQQPALQAVEYVAVQMKPGLNHLELVQSDLFGNVRGRSLIDVTAPDRMARLDVTFSTLEPAADGRTPVEVRVTAVDAGGIPVTASLPLTLETTLGRWEVEDVNAREPGTQVFLKDGAATYRLIPPVEPGEARIVVSSGAMKAERRLAFLPELRPMIAAGIIEGRFAFNKLSSSNILPLDPGDAFESELRESAGIGSDGTASGRAAFYLKGKISGQTLLTVAYDSDKRKDDVRLFRDIDPDAYYPVYGDSSVKGYDAQSTGKLYVRIDHNRSFLLLGDFNTRADNEVRQLGDYNRSFNGVRVQHETARFRGGLWASDDSTDQVIREIPANGTSGPFNFSTGDGVLGSETVEILVRDRNQRSVILRTTTLARNADYDFEPFSGRLLLRRPVASVDENFNPQSIRISYEVDTGGPKFWVYGGDAQVKLHERFEVGASFARDENPVDPYDLQSANATFRIASGTYLMVEGARSDSLLDPADASRSVGYAGRIDLRHRSANTEARVYFGKTEESFNNPASTLNAGRVEGSAKVTHQLAPRTQLIGEGIYTEDIAGSGNLKGVRADVAYTFENQVRVAVGGRYSEETQTPANPGADAADTPLTVRSVRARVDTPVPRLPQANVFAEYEQDVVESEQRLVAAGGAYQVSTKTRLYARHEFISSLGSDFELNTSQQNNRTLVGLETEYLQDAYFYNEYRVLDAIDGGQAEASTGLRNLWNVADGLRLNTTFERVTPFDGDGTNRSTAATAAFDYTRPADWKATGRLEGRWGDSSDNYLNTFGYARKLDEQWTFLGRSILNTQLYDDAASSDLWQGRLLAGLAWRQTEKDEWNALFRYEYKYERGSSALGDEAMRRQVHTLATSVNYQPDRRWIFSGHYAGKFVIERGGYGGSTDYFAHLLAGRAIFEITEKWDAGLNLAVMFSDSFRNAQYAVGPEIGRVFTKNVRIGLGYNLVGFTDRDFDTASTAQGLFLSLRIKFDENLFKWASFKKTEDAR